MSKSKCPTCWRPHGKSDSKAFAQGLRLYICKTCKHQTVRSTRIIAKS